MREDGTIQFGALAPELSEQGWMDIDGHLQRDADAISRLVIRGLLTAKQAEVARRKLGDRIAEAQKP